MLHQQPLQPVLRVSKTNITRVRVYNIFVIPAQVEDTRKSARIQNYS